MASKTLHKHSPCNLEQGSSSVTTVHRHSVVDHQCISVQAMWRASSAGPQPTTFRA